MIPHLTKSETIEVPFRQLEDASTIHLLSVYYHPTDGCDYFFNHHHQSTHPTVQSLYPQNVRSGHRKSFAS